MLRPLMEDRMEAQGRPRGMTMSFRGLGRVFGSGLGSVLVLAGLVGCPRPAVRPYPPPSAAELAAYLRERVSRVGSMRSEAKVDYFEGRGQRVRVTMDFPIAPPGRLRVDAESPIGGAVIGSLASDGDRFQYLDVERNRYVLGPARPCNLGRLLRVNLGPADMVAVIAGVAPLLGEPVSVRWKSREGGREVLLLRGPRGEEETIELEARERRWNVRRAELREPGGQLRYRLEHEDFGPGEPALPGKTHIVEPARKVDVLIRYREHERGVTPPEGAFHLDPPMGLEPEVVDCEP